MITTALFVTYLYENQFKQGVATDSAKNVLMKRLEGMKIGHGCLNYTIQGKFSRYIRWGGSVVPTNEPPSRRSTELYNYITSTEEPPSYNTY